MHLFLFKVVKPYLQDGEVAWDYSDWRQISFVNTANSEEEALAELAKALPPKNSRVEKALAQISEIPTAKYFQILFIAAPLNHTVNLFVANDSLAWENRWL